ncbi:MAG: hypothetical protein N4A72_19830 [Bacteroidales bacterium]|jgi:cell division protein FtsB|nr:hypothetical protein [Bacteroidales bacterium]
MNKTYRALLIVLSIVIVGLGVVLYMQHTESQEVQQLLETEKQGLTDNLMKLREEYQSLETDNDSINRHLLEEQIKVETLLKEIKKVKRNSYAEIKKYKKELGTLRAIMRSYIRQIDSLNTRNQMLMAENEEIKTQYNEEVKLRTELSEKATELESQVALGSRIVIEGLEAVALTKRSKDTRRARKTVKIRTCVTLKKNAIAKPGVKMVYVRIIGPDGFVMANAPTDIIKVEDKNVVFSASREVNYENADVELCIFWDSKSEMAKGTYKINVYTEGYELGETELYLK